MIKYKINVNRKAGVYLDIIVDEIKARYPTGTRIKLIAFNNSFKNKKEGLLGTVVLVDDLGTLHMQWDDGSSVGLIVDEDHFLIVTDDN